MFSILLFYWKKFKMNTNDAGLDLIKSFESCRLTAYKDVVGIPTIGYGHIEGVQLGDTIDQAKADLLLSEDLEHFEHGVTNLLTTEVTDNQFSALVCFAFN